ncbi:MAG: ribosome biogenesis GTP-binding protein YihA/YsxC [Rhodospirillales bacterium]
MPERDRPETDTNEIGPSDAEAAFARWLFAQPCRFFAGAASEDRLPPSEVPEVAFVGRSNVGKSSLVNALTGQKTLAKVSRTPGRTQQINFFDLTGRLTLVDLPGYGYAKAAKSSIDSWTQLTQRYLKGRRGLERVMILIDGRHGLKASDRAVMAALDEAARPYQLILTKGDLVKASAREALLAAVSEEAASYRAAHPEVLLTSAEKGLGLEALRLSAATLASPPSRD